MVLAGEFMSIKSNRGFALLSSVSVVSVLMLLGSFVLQKTANTAIYASKQNLQDNMSYFANKSLGLGSYLVANNLVLCKSRSWANGKRCRWGGSFHNPKVKDKDFQLKVISASESDIPKTSLTLQVNFNELPKGFKELLIFDLIQFNTKEGLEIFGDIPKEIHSVDADYSVVTIRSKIYNEETGYVFERENGIRRPLAKIKLASQSKGACNMSCVASFGQSPNPSCRGPQEIPKESVTQLNLKASNEGPGAVYEIVLTKERKYDSRFFDRESDVKSINLMKTSEVIMPGQSVLLSDTIECLRPKYVTQTVTGPAPSASVHSETFSTIDYYFDFEGYRDYTVNKNKEKEYSGHFEPPRLLKKTEEIDLKYNNTQEVVTNYVQVASHAH